MRSAIQNAEITHAILVGLHARLLIMANASPSHAKVEGLARQTKRMRASRHFSYNHIHDLSQGNEQYTPTVSFRVGVSPPFE